MIACNLACGYAQQLFVCVSVDSRNFIDKKPGHTRTQGRRKIWKSDGVSSTAVGIIYPLPVVIGSNDLPKFEGGSPHLPPLYYRRPWYAVNNEYIVTYLVFY
jgi:hypothetical protein